MKDWKSLDTILCGDLFEIEVTEEGTKEIIMSNDSKYLSEIKSSSESSTTPRRMHYLL